MDFWRFCSLIVTLAGFSGSSLAENSSIRLRGNATRFGLRDGRLMLPDCLLLDVKAPYTTWEPNSRPTAQEMQHLFDALGRAEAVPARRFPRAATRAMPMPGCA